MPRDPKVAIGSFYLTPESRTPSKILSVEQVSDLGEDMHIEITLAQARRLVARLVKLLHKHEEKK